MGGGGVLMRNNLLSKTFRGPLITVLNIFRDPLLVSLKFKTPRCAKTFRFQSVVP